MTDEEWARQFDLVLELVPLFAPTWIARSTARNGFESDSTAVQR